MKKLILNIYLLILCSVMLYSDPPTNVEIQIDNSNSVLSWSEVTNADFYYIYRSTKPDTSFVKIDSVTVTTYTDSDAILGNKYFYYVTAEEEEIITVTDIDGNIYQTVEIEDQIWMAENLKVTHYRNGDAIQYVQQESVEPNVWENLSTGAYSYYDDIQSNQDTYGNLYNWYAVVDSRNIAPVGWHVPTDEEIKELEMALGMSQAEADDTGWRGTTEGSKLSGREDLWSNGVLENNPVFDTSGFCLLPAGARSGATGGFSSIFTNGVFWSSTENGTHFAWGRDLSYLHTDVYRGEYNNKPYGFSVRCVRD